MQKSLEKLNISSETIGAVFIIIFVSFFVLTNLLAGFVWPLFILAMTIALAIAVIYPRAGLLAVVFLTIVWERYFTLQTFWIGRTEYKIYPLDILIVGILLAIAGQYIFGKIKKVSWHKSDYALLLFIFINAIYFLASNFSGVDSGLAFSTFKNYAFYSLVYFITIFLIRTKDDLQRLFKFFLAGGMAIVIFIILGLVRGEGLWSQFTPLSTSGVRLLAFPHGLFISLTILPMILYPLFMKKKSRWVYLLIAVWAVGIAGTLMRHLWIALAGMLIALFVFLPQEKRRALLNFFWRLVAPIGITIFFISFVALMMPQSDFSRSAGKFFGVLSQRATSLASVSADESFSWRSLVWKGAYAEFKDTPVFGIGTGKRIYVETINYKDFIEIRNIHNSYLSILIQLGLLGASVILYFFYKVTRGLWRSTGGEEYGYYKFSILAVLGIYFLSIPFQPYLETNLLAIFFWMGLGLARVMPEMRS